MMAVMILLSIATCMSLVTVLFGCLICRRKLSEQEIQRKAFEKFRKRHMFRDRILSSRVDYIRSVSEGKSASCITGMGDHTYEEMFTPPIHHPPSIQVQEPSPLHSSDYSFFDDSFQTVIEASSSNASSTNSGMTNLLMAPRNNQASYMSLQQAGSQTCLSSTGEQTTSESEGEVNEGFSDSCNSSTSNGGSSDSLNDSYIVPACGPRIKVIQPSVRKKFETSLPLANVQAGMPGELHLPLGSTDEKALGQKDEETMSKSAPNINEGTIYSCLTDENQDFSKDCVQDCHGNQMLKQKSLQKLALEGPTYSENNIFLNSSESRTYEPLKSARSEQSMYKSLHKTALILPGRPRICSPLTSRRSEEKSRSGSPGRSRQLSSTTSKCTDHTYESIGSFLAGEINRRDSVVSADSTFNNTNGDQIVYIDNSDGHKVEQNDLSCTSPDHTYESIRSRVQSEVEKSEIACENSAVVIGRRVSNPFDSSKMSKRMVNKKKQKSVKTKTNVNQSEKNVQKDGEDRYSPFPNAKKLAFKSAFRQVPSPRFSVIQTVAGGLNSQLLFNPEMCPDNLNIKTPEIKVENCPQYFDNTAFISPKLLNANTIFTEDESQKEKDTIDFISPMRTYLTLKDCYSSKVNHSNLQASLTEKQLNYRKSLPSLSDHLEEEIVRHCNTNMNSRSTPCELDQPESVFF